MTKADILARIDAMLQVPERVEKTGTWRLRQLERLQLDLEIDLRREREAHQDVRADTREAGGPLKRAEASVSTPDVLIGDSLART